MFMAEVAFTLAKSFDKSVHENATETGTVLTLATLSNWTQIEPILSGVYTTAKIALN
jgi:hypothetical protein